MCTDGCDGPLSGGVTICTEWCRSTQQSAHLSKLPVNTVANYSVTHSITWLVSSTWHAQTTCYRRS